MKVLGGQMEDGKRQHAKEKHGLERQIEMLNGKIDSMIQEMMRLEDA
jgi:hypothetical protein